MLKAICKIRSAEDSPISFSRYVAEPLMENETHNEWEERVWKDRCHYNKKRQAVIPRTFFHKALIGAACYLGEKIVGRGNKTYAAKFIGGIQIVNAIPLNQTRETVEGEWLLMSSNPSQKNSGKVMRCYPRIPEWAGTLEVLILDDTIPKDVFERHLRAAGLFVGLGRWRKAVGGEYGRFDVEGVKFEALAL